MSKRWITASASLLALLGLIMALAYGWLEQQWQQPLRVPTQGARLTVEPGDSLGRVLHRAEAAGWLAHARWVGFVAARQGLDGGLHVGEYELPSGLTAEGLVAKLASGEVVTYKVTLPEGIRLADALEILCAAEALECTLTGVADADLLALLPDGSLPEGWFLPETYHYRRGERDIDVLARAHELMRETLVALWADRDMGLPLTSAYEALTLASIVERETGVVSERKAIAGVFTRRLQQGMRLQTDPTVIYGLGAAYQGNLTRAHLRDTENPYNTYRIDGLPPTPISLPGKAALSAVMHPADGHALYFVARGDGTHAFAATLTEHQENVRRFQLKRRSDYRSSPP